MLFRDESPLIIRYMPLPLYCTLARSPGVVVSRGVVHLEAVAGVVGPRREQPATATAASGRLVRCPTGRVGGRRGRPLDGRRRADHVRVDLGQRLHRLAHY